MKKQLTEKRVEQIIALAKTHQNYQPLLMALNELQNLSNVERKVEEAFVVDTKNPDTPPIGKIKLAFEDKAEMDIVFKEIKGKFELQFFGAAFTPNRDGVKLFSVKDKKATAFLSKDLETGAEEETEEEQDGATIQASFGDGCYPYYVMGNVNIGYSYCGRNCGTYGDFGGGSSRDALDDCCKAHDNCWRTYGNGDCQCDEILLDCAADNKWTNYDLYVTINAVFDRC
ncbi:hypothetical protein [Halobacillus halophilus]|uniref:hypothetical protein n=1 Tax=Halobacillus halophilus TaxID=1570 RepID=UPI001CD4B72E|nr:hypothetical protein [Halobacillus halophilus]MCA1012808.1 hypothetical protein [Halobacillus halophilus]